MRRTTPASPNPPVSQKPAEDNSGQTPHAVERQLYAHALETRTPVSWNLFHQTGDILFTAEDKPKSRAIRSGQAALRLLECTSLRRKPRFSHVFLCVTPGLYIESTPVALLHAHDKPAVRAVRAEEQDRRKRSDFLVMRPYALFDNPDINAKLKQRSIFHYDKPYNFRPVSASKDAVRCSELVTAIYGDLGIELVPNRKHHETLPFDIEIALEQPSAWLDVTELYVMAETLCDEKLIKSDRGLRDMFFQQYASGTEITKLLNGLDEATDSVLKDIGDQMKRPVQISPSQGPLTYVANLKELVANLKKYLRYYDSTLRNDHTGPMPEPFRYDGIAPTELYRKLKRVEDEFTKLAWMCIKMIRDDYLAECQRFVATATQAEAILAQDATQEAATAAVQQLKQLVRAANEREPEVDRTEGPFLVQETSALLKTIENAEILHDADAKIMKGFTFAATMLHILARHIEGLFFGSELLKHVQLLIAAEDGSLHGEEVLAAIAPSRQLLRDQFRKQHELFAPSLKLHGG